MEGEQARPEEHRPRCSTPSSRPPPGKAWPLLSRSDSGNLAAGSVEAQRVLTLPGDGRGGLASREQMRPT